MTRTIAALSTQKFWLFIKSKCWHHAGADTFENWSSSNATSFANFILRFIKKSLALKSVFCVFSPTWRNGKIFYRETIFLKWMKCWDIQNRCPGTYLAVYQKRFLNSISFSTDWNRLKSLGPKLFCSKHGKCILQENNNQV